MDATKTPQGKLLRSQRRRQKRSARRQERLKAFDRNGWQILSDNHFRRIVAGKPLDYAPTTKKFTYDGKTHKGDPIKFIEGLTK